MAWWSRGGASNDRTAISAKMSLMDGRVSIQHRSWGGACRLQRPVEELVEAALLDHSNGPELAAVG